MLWEVRAVLGQLRHAWEGGVVWCAHMAKDGIQLRLVSSAGEQWGPIDHLRKNTTDTPQRTQNTRGERDDAMVSPSPRRRVPRAPALKLL